MEYGSLTADQRRLYRETVTGSHSRRFTVLLLDLDGKVKRDLTDGYQGGSLQGDDSRAPVEVFEASVLDRQGRLDWTNGEHRHFQLRVIDHRFVPGIGADGAWVEEVGFEGPIWDFTRQGPDVKIVAHSGERLAMGSVRNTFTRPRKAKAHAVIDDLLAAAGAKRSQRRIPRLKARLPKSVTIGVRRGKDDPKTKKRDERRRVQILRADPASATYYGTAAGIAAGIDRELFWEPGRFVLAAPQNKPSLTLTDATVLAPVEEKRGKEGEVPNTWLVLGHKPKGKKRIAAKVQLPNSHPASPRKMGWNNTPRNITERVENEKLRRKKQARAVGIRRRNAAMRELVVYQVQAIPVRARLRPNSLAWVPTASGRARVRVKQWTIPYSAGADAMTIGVNRRRG